MVESLFKRGLIFKARKGEEIKFYRVKSVPQMHDSTSLTPGLPRKILDLWKAYMQKEWPAYGQTITDFLPGSVMRVIPVNERVDPESRILAYDDVIKIIEGARSLSVTKCSCRVIDGSCGKPLEVCMQVDRAAEYNIERGTGRPLTKSEAIKIIKLCEEEGLVHVVDNRQTVGHVICNCCKDCCLNWQIMKGPKKWVAPSRFVALVDSDLCTGCETCTERCFSTLYPWIMIWPLFMRKFAWVAASALFPALRRQYDSRKSGPPTSFRLNRRTSIDVLRVFNTLFYAG